MRIVMVLSAFSSEVKRSVTIISSYHGAEVQTLTKKMGKEKQNVVCVCARTHTREKRERFIITVTGVKLTRRMICYRFT